MKFGCWRDGSTRVQGTVLGGCGCVTIQVRVGNRALHVLPLCVVNALAITMSSCIVFVWLLVCWCGVALLFTRYQNMVWWRVTGLGTHGIVQVKMDKHFTFVTLCLTAHVHVQILFACSVDALDSAFCDPCVLCAATPTTKLSRSVLSMCSCMSELWLQRHINGAGISFVRSVREITRTSFS